MTQDYSSLCNIAGKRLHSLRNEVYLLEVSGTNFVRKKYRTRESFDTELHNLQLLNGLGLHVPQVIWSEAPFVILSHIPGKTYLEILDEIDADAIHALCDWLNTYHSVTGSLRMDVNLRNFLYCNGACFSVDFEEPFSPGSPETDIGRLLAFTATYDPGFTQHKQAVCRLMLDSFLQLGADLLKITAAYQDELTAMLQRRPNPFPCSEETARGFTSHL